MSLCLSYVLRSGLTVSLSHSLLTVALSSDCRTVFSLLHCLLTVALSHSLFASWCGLVVHLLRQLVRQLVRVLVRVLVRLLVPLQVSVLLCGRKRVRGTSSRGRGTPIVALQLWPEWFKVVSQSGSKHKFVSQSRTNTR